MILRSSSYTPLWVTLLNWSGLPKHDSLNLIVMAMVITISFSSLLFVLGCVLSRCRACSRLREKFRGVFPPLRGGPRSGIEMVAVQIPNGEESSVLTA